MKLLCDRMLGTLAKWLRVYGFDTYYPSQELDDFDLIIIAKKEKRVLITRDKELVYNAKKELVDVIFINSKILDEQLKTVLKKIKFDKNKVLTRCLICNNVLKNISKDKIKDKVPEKIFEKHNYFLYCKKCDKIYWKGTHYEKMIEKISKF